MSICCGLLYPPNSQLVGAPLSGRSFPPHQLTLKPHAMSSFFGGSSSSSDSSSLDSSSAKSRIQTQLQTESALTNAKALIAKVNENCFSSCIPNPGPSLSSKEQTCLSQCMEKYIEAWNLTSKTYISQLGNQNPGLRSAGSSGGLLS